MKVKLLSFVAAMLALAAISFAQPTNYAFVIYDFNTNATVMWENCSDVPVPDGRLLKLMVDANGNGPDAADQQIPQGDCLGCANFNQDRVNGEAALGVPGTHSPENQLVINLSGGNIRVYMNVYCADETTINSSTPVQTLAAGGTGDIYIMNMINCVACVQGPVCDPDTDVTLRPDNTNFPAPQTVSACVQLGTTPTSIMVPVFNSSNVPQAHVIPGCANDPTCAPAQGIIYDDNAWVYSDVPSPHFTNFVASSGEGCCATIFLDYVLPVGLTGFTAVAHDNSVDLNWTAGNAFDSYVIERDNNAIATVRGDVYNYTDRTAENGTTYSYTVYAVDASGARVSNLSAEATPSANKALVTEYALHQNYPNPFNPSTSLRFDLVENNFVTLKVYNAAGQEVATLVNGNMPKGVNLVNFDASNLTSGLYFYTVKVGNVYSATKKMLLVK